MENMFVWTLVFAGATVGLLGIFLIASERELKSKRREIEALVGKLDSSGGGDTGRTVHPSATEIRPLADSGEQNPELLAQVSSLSARLEASQKVIEEIEPLRHRLSDYEAANRQLQLGNERLQNEIAALNSELEANAARVATSSDETRDSIGRAVQLETQLAKLQGQLDERDRELTDLADTRQRLAGAATEAAARQQQLEEQIEALKRERTAQEENLAELTAVRNHLREMDQVHEELQAENRSLRQEIAAVRERLAASEETHRRLSELRQLFGELHARQRSIAETERQLETEMTALAKQLEDCGTCSRPSSEVPDGFGAIVSAPADDGPIASARELINQRRYYDALASLNALLQEQPDHREARLHHLLASIHLEGVQGRDKEIDAIKDMAELSESERTAARDIFLLRADAAQKGGQDNDMLRYRAWARNVIYRSSTPPLVSAAGAQDLASGTSNGSSIE